MSYCYNQVTTYNDQGNGPTLCYSICFSRTSGGSHVKVVTQKDVMQHQRALHHHQMIIVHQNAKDHFVNYAKMKCSDCKDWYVILVLHAIGLGLGLAPTA